VEAREQRVVLILADISGYTKFMVENQLSALHGQLVITAIIEALLKEVDIPLRLQGIEGDAVFAYAEYPGTDERWREVLADIREKLLRFFEAFYAGVIAAIESTPCKCAICRNIDQMQLKIIVHSGRAVLSTIAGTQQVSGTDVILAHRLLKNSVPSSEYLLMTEAAYRDLGRDMQGRFEERSESYAELGTVKIFVHYLGEVKIRHRDALYAMSPARLTLAAEKYVLGAGLRDQLAALVAQIRHPIVPVGWLRRAGFVLWWTFTTPLLTLLYVVLIPLKLLSRQAARRSTTS
jgi:class 3 adenylate cyclase